jgi:hypothetical protein
VTHDIGIEVGGLTNWVGFRLHGSIDAGKEVTMNAADVLELEKIAITQLVAHSDIWADLAEPTPQRNAGASVSADSVRRLEQLGLVTRSPARNGVSLTSAGVEALAYLAKSW